MVIHGSSTQKPHSHVVGKLDFVDISAVGPDVGAVVNLIFGVNQSHALGPVPGLLSMVGIRLIVGVPSEARGKIEEAAIGDGILQGVNGDRIGVRGALPCSRIR